MSLVGLKNNRFNNFRMLQHILALNPNNKYIVSIGNRTISVISSNPYIVLKFPLLDLAKVLSMLPKHTVNVYNTTIQNTVLARINTVNYHTWNLINFAGRVYRITMIASETISMETI